MISPLDLWTIAHGSVGYLLGELKFRRWLAYLMPVGWEIGQLLFHYPSRGLGLEDVWANSMVDILVYIAFYETALRYPVKRIQKRLRPKMRTRAPNYTSTGSWESRFLR